MCKRTEVVLIQGTIGKQIWEEAVYSVEFSKAAIERFEREAAGAVHDRYAGFLLPHVISIVKVNEPIEITHGAPVEIKVMYDMTRGPVGEYCGHELQLLEEDSYDNK